MEKEFFRVPQKAMIKNSEKFLVVKRQPNAHTYPNHWDFPGGKHDPGETAEEAVKREVYEETGFIIVPGEVIKELVYKDKHHDIHFYIFSIKSYSGDFALSEDHSESLWVSKEEIKNLGLHPSVSLFSNG